MTDQAEVVEEAMVVVEVDTVAVVEVDTVAVVEEVMVVGVVVEEVASAVATVVAVATEDTVVDVSRPATTDGEALELIFLQQLSMQLPFTNTKHLYVPAWQFHVPAPYIDAQLST